MSEDIIQKIILKRIIEASNHIHKSSMKGSGNFIVTSPHLSSLFPFERIKKILESIKNGQTK